MRLFEMERAAQAALTSCAWFFDDFGGLEGRVVLRWAARAVELAAEFAASVEPELLERLRQIHSNRREIGDAATLYLSLKTREARGRAMIAMADEPSSISNRFCAKGANFRRAPNSADARAVKSLAEYEALYRRAEQDPEAFWGECARRTRLVQALRQGARMEIPVRQVVRRR